MENLHFKDICQMFVHSRCFPDQAIFNRHLADLRVLSGNRTFVLKSFVDVTFI